MIQNRNKIIANLSKGLLIVAGIATAFCSCSEDFLKPDPLSFYEPGKTFSTRSGLEAALAMCDRHLRGYWSYYNTQDLSLPISTEYMFSDVVVAGKTDDSNIFADIATRLTPSTGIDNNNTNRLSYFWGESYTGIKYANSVLNYIDNVELDEKTKNEFKGRAYFHRSFRYLALCFQFKDIPFVTKILEVPKQNYRSTKREAILEKITADMEDAVKWVPEQKDMTMIGMVSKGACRQLLIKCYLATGRFQEAKEQADILINESGYKLMEKEFGTFINPHPDTWNITRNVIWDLHRPENKCIKANTEAILSMPNRAGTDAAIALKTMRNWVPFWNGDVKSPSNKKAVQNYAQQVNGSSNANYSPMYDYNKALGRGIGHIRPTYFATHSLWYVNGKDDKGDLRHNSEVGNWARMEDMKYNDPGDKEWYGKNLRLYDDNGNILCSDTIRCWYDWPHYKFWVETPEQDLPTNNNYQGGAADWYCFRLAETYLLRAEAKFYLGDIKGAAEDVNVIRKRADCDELYPETNTGVTIGDIMDERARELYMEEWRHMELSRVSYSLALSGKPDEWGNTYSVDKLSENSYWFQRIEHYNNYYNKHNVTVKGREYLMAPHNIYFPIPKSSSDGNLKGQLSQNPGYDGYDPGVPMWDNWQDAVADESKVD